MKTPIAFLLGFWVMGVVIILLTPSPTAVQALQGSITTYTQTQVNQVSLSDHDKNRLDALDGGKERRWRCADLGTQQDKDGTYSYVGGWGAYWYTGATKVELSNVIKTIGAETPKQLGYEICKEIPQSDWDVTKEPVNQ